MVLLLTLVPQNQNLPKAFHQLPAEVREKATVIVTGNLWPGKKALASLCLMEPKMGSGILA
jgi:hypothetical protein